MRGRQTCKHERTAASQPCVHSLEETMVQIQLLPTDWQLYSFASIPLFSSNHTCCTLDTEWLPRISVYLILLTAATKMNV
jgi:hypothetical protein